MFPLFISWITWAYSIVADELQRFNVSVTALLHIVTAYNLIDLGKRWLT